MDLSVNQISELGENSVNISKFFKQDIHRNEEQEKESTQILKPKKSFFKFISNKKKEKPLVSSKIVKKQIKQNQDFTIKSMDQSIKISRTPNSAQPNHRRALDPISQYDFV